MAEVTQTDMHVDQLLTNMSIGYKNSVYIADDICPLVPVQKRSDIVPKYDQSHWFRNSAQLRAPGTRSQRTGYTVDTTDTYYCHRYSHGVEIPDEVRDNTDAPFNMDRDANMFATDKVMMKREAAFAADFFTTSVWGTDKVGGTDFTAWSTYGSSTPLVDLTNYVDDVEGLTAQTPNTLAMGKQVWSSLKWHPDVIDTIKHTQRAQMTTEIFGALIEVPRILIGRAITTSDPEGTAEASVTYTRIWGKHALLSYVPASPTLMAPAACYTFTWSRVPNSIQYTKRMRDEEREVDIIEVNSYFDQKLTAANSGLFISAAVA